MFTYSSRKRGWKKQFETNSRYINRWVIQLRLIRVVVGSSGTYVCYVCLFCFVQMLMLNIFSAKTIKTAYLKN